MERQSYESSDEGATRRRRERTLELAGMFKEIQKGSEKVKETILARFSVQEGVNVRKTRDYFKLLCDTGLIKITNGHKSWCYVPEAEWELFKVEI